MAKDQEAEIAQKFGAIAIKDDRRGNGWNQYQLNGWRTWTCFHAGIYQWVTARLVDCRWADHTYFKSLQLALGYCKNHGGGE